MTSTQPTANPTLKPPPISIPQPPPLLLTIRFSAAIPDLELDIPRPSTTTVISLKHTIRQRLSEPNSQRRLRFIHGGKILPDTAALSSVLRAPLPPPPPSPSPGFGYASSGGGGDAKGKGADSSSGGGGGNGSSADGRGKGKSVPGRPDPSQRIYVNCSIGDSLTTAELLAEAAQASAPAPPPSSPLYPSSPSGTPLPPGSNANGLGTPLPSTTAAPRGFDRLLNAGFSAAEVNQLRLQFRSIQASRYTPDTLPSPDGFRRMEDAWIDDNGASVPTTSLSNPGAGAGGTDSDDVGLVALVDVMIRGVITGFMWPLGSAGWLVREEGMASGRWRFMVGVGVVFSVLIGIIRNISGEK
ncbi:DUF2407 C-terminal domain-containing protein [Annulohypoxylon truncatum]|uniref:DUF2407 C-terminal domain-containing protein n=1 Tax=Annulohypoxylon truncatum TaxID=327061 RepID=UPI002008B268|nr:DUF2407 C-terminal domain-containing protein [Annulohypoxylon truncatum]KAI1210710.1 DUF2407 C-terminal domain-containing protein [Annulohypoxylon truncatum]